jgi:hypothetical protein
MMAQARLTAVSEGSYPAPWAGRQVIVTLPEQIDVSHADQVSKSLLGVINRRRARCHLVYPANDDAGRPTAPGRQTNVAPACGSFCNWPVLSR